MLWQMARTQRLLSELLSETLDALLKWRFDVHQEIKFIKIEGTNALHLSTSNSPLGAYSDDWKEIPSNALRKTPAALCKMALSSGPSS